MTERLRKTTDGRTPEQLVADDDHRWPPGFVVKLGADVRCIHIPPNHTGLDRKRFLRALLLAEPESAEESEKRRDSFYRAGGDVVCPQCGEKFYDHPNDSADEYLTIICNRDRVKL